MKQEEIKAKLKVEKEVFKMKMDLLVYKRESDRLHHEHEMERGRIKSAEIRKSQERKFRGDRA